MSGRRLTWLLIGAGVLVAITLGVRQSFGVFLKPVVEDLAISREAFGLAIALQNLVWGMAQPFAGMLADRFGGRRVLLVGAAVYIGGLVLAAHSQTALDLHLSLGLLVGLGLSATSFAVVFGAVSRAVAPQRRSMALGLVSAGGSIGMFSMVPGSQALILQLGWSNALTILAAMLLLVPLCALLLDGHRPVGAEASAHSASLRMALNDAGTHSGYWLLNAGFFVCGFHVAFIATHLPAYLEDRAMSPMTAAWALALIGLMNVVGTLAFGWFGGLYRKKYLLSALYLGRAVVIALFLIVPLSSASTLVFAATLGLLWLATVPLTSGLVSDIFGVRYLGTLFGIVFLSHQAGSFLGAWLGGYVFDLTGSYDLVWTAAVLLGLASALLHWPINDAPRVPATAGTPAGAR